MQFGRVVDATLMIDKDTGRPRGFGFVTFDSESAVEATLSRPLEIHGKPIEVKKAQPRGNMREDNDNRRGTHRGMREDRFRDDERSSGPDNLQQQSAQGQANPMGGVTPQMMAQYWQRMQQYFSVMQQQMAGGGSQGQPMGGGAGPGGMNPAMLQQMQQMKQSPNMNAMGGAQSQGGMSPPPQSPGSQGMQGAMSPAMMQQMQMQQNQGQGAAGFGPGSEMGGQMNGAVGPSGGNSGMGGSPSNMGMEGNYAANRSGPGYNAYEQLAFEQQKYEQQQARRVMESQNFPGPQQGGPTSWEGMYDDVPQPHIPGASQGGMGPGGGSSVGGGMSPSQGASVPPNKLPTPQPQSAPPANAPTGPRNAGKPGANYRGGGRGAHRGFHPYARG